MSAELDALLDAIRANPEDDLPRLALADWCAEQPDPATQARGEFIHCRCRAAALPLGDPERGRLERRARELREEHEAAWLGGVEALVTGWDFERGCVLVEVTYDSLRFYPLDRLAAAPGWRWVIGVRGVLLDWRDARRLAGSPLLSRLTSLCLRDCALGREGARALAESPHAAHLAALHLDYCELGDDGVGQLARSPHLGRLTTLTLSSNRVGKDGAQALAGADRLSRLVRLDLSLNRLGAQGALALAWSPRLPGLRELLLASCQLPDRVGGQLAMSPRLEQLTLLDVTDNKFRSATLDELRERFGGRLRA